MYRGEGRGEEGRGDWLWDIASIYFSNANARSQSGRGEPEGTRGGGGVWFRAGG